MNSHRHRHHRYHLDHHYTPYLMQNFDTVKETVVSVDFQCLKTMQCHLNLFDISGGVQGACIKKSATLGLNIN